MNRCEKGARAKGSALPLVLVFFVVLLPMVMVFSQLSQREVSRTRRSQNERFALALAQEALDHVQDGLQSGSPVLAVAADRPQGGMTAFVYEAPGSRPDRRVYYAATRGEAGGSVRTLLATLEVVEPPRVPSRIVIPHDVYIYYGDRAISSAADAAELIDERDQLLAARREQLVRERSLSESEFRLRLETMKGYLDSGEFQARWELVRDAMIEGRSRP